MIKRMKFFLLTGFFLSLFLPVYAQPLLTTMRTSKSMGAEFVLHLVAGGKVVIDLGNGEKIDVQVSKAYGTPSVHQFKLPVDNAEIKIYAETLTYLDCSNNNLKTLDVSQDKALRTLKCQNNHLKMLDLVNNHSLTFLWCMSNQLKTLDLRKNTELVQLSVNGNQLSGIDLSNNIKLTTLIVSRNNLRTLDVSNNVNLQNLDARNCGISALDLSKNIYLTNVSIENGGSTNANSFTASSLNQLYKSLVVQLGRLYVVNSSYQGSVDNDVKHSDINLAKNRGWYVLDRKDDKDLTGVDKESALSDIHTLVIKDGKPTGEHITPSADFVPYDDHQVSKKAVRANASECLKPKTFESKTASITIENNKITRLYNKLTKTTWTLENTPLFQVDINGVESTLEAVGLGNGQVKLTLSITNTSNEKLYPTPTFPMVNGAYVNGNNSDDLNYYYPKQGYGPSNIEPVDYNEYYSAYFPLQFIDVYDAKGGGIYIMTNDTTNYAKRYSLSKKNGKVDMKVTFKARALEPGETWQLPSVLLGVHQGDWHEAFVSYRDWVRTWYKPYTSRKKWFREVFNFRQIFIHPIFGESGIFNPETKDIDLVTRVEESKKAFGGVDYVHIFDWQKTPRGRIIDYDPWSYLGGTENLAEQIKLVKQSGLPVGLYFEGYIMSHRSKIGKAHGKEWQQIDMAGKPFTRWGPANYLPCAFVPDFQEYIGNLVNNTAKVLGVDGVYLDQYGFCYQYGCYHPGHTHDSNLTDFKTNLQTRGEALMAKSVKEKIRPDQILYIEETPTDVSTQYTDGCFSYTIQKGRPEASHNPSAIDMARFALPDYKIFQIVNGTRPNGNDLDGFKYVFFNGEGNWLAGPSNDPVWFSDDLKKTIRKTHAILRKYREAFLSMDVMPLVPVLQKDVYANYFPSKKANVWTLFNASKDKIEGTMLKIKHLKGAIYYDEWNNRKLTPTFKNGYAYINLSILGRDAGCVVQKKM